MDYRDRLGERVNVWFRHILTSSYIVLIWAISIFVFSLAFPFPQWNLGEAATILFGSASIALFVFSILMGVLAVVGWKALEGVAERATEKAVRESFENAKKAIDSSAEDLRQKIDFLQLESRGRVHSGLGYMLGEMSIDSESRVINPSKLEEAIIHCRLGYDFLKKIEGGARFNGLNNLVFYSCLFGDERHRDTLLEQARELMVAGRRNRSPGKEYLTANLELTACRAILQFGSKPEEIQEARATLKYLLELPHPPTIRKEALLILNRFPHEKSDLQQEVATLQGPTLSASRAQEHERGHKEESSGK